jgi:hypothetical protein
MWAGPPDGVGPDPPEIGFDHRSNGFLVKRTWSNSVSARKAARRLARDGQPVKRQRVKRMRVVWH